MVQMACGRARGVTVSDNDRTTTERLVQLVVQVQNPGIWRAVEELQGILAELNDPDLEELYAAVDTMHIALESISAAWSSANLGRERSQHRSDISPRAVDRWGRSRGNVVAGKPLDLPTTQILERTGDTTVTVSVGPESVTEWLLHLSLLKYHLLDSITIAPTGVKPLTIRVDTAPELPPVGRVEWSSNRIDILVSREELDAWVTFFLQYYQRGRASADHIDVIIPPDQSSNNKRLVLTLQIVHPRPMKSRKR